MVLIFCLVCIGHARARDEEVVSASQVYFLPNPPRYPRPGQPPALSLRHIVDKVRKLSPLSPGVELELVLIISSVSNPTPKLC